MLSNHFLGVLGPGGPVFAAAVEGRVCKIWDAMERGWPSGIAKVRIIEADHEIPISVPAGCP